MVSLQRSRIWISLVLLVVSVLSWAQGNGAYMATVSALTTAAKGGHLSGAPAPGKDQIAGICEIAGAGDVDLKTPCNGIQIVLTKTGAGEVARTTVDSKGEFRFSLLPPGEYDVNVDSPKFKLAKPIQKLATGRSYLISLKR